MVQWVIAEVMADKSLVPEEVQARYRRHSVYGWGTFKCVDCRLSWMSQITWVTLDLKEQRIRRRFKQKCKKCDKQQRPWWHVEEFAFMVEFAINRYRKLLNGTWKPAAGPPILKNIPPHKSELCERCNFGERKCWCVIVDTLMQENEMDSKLSADKLLENDVANGDSPKSPTKEADKIIINGDVKDLDKPVTETNAKDKRTFRRRRKASLRKDSISKGKMNGIEEKDEQVDEKDEDKIVKGTVSEENLDGKVEKGLTENEKVVVDENEKSLTEDKEKTNDESLSSEEKTVDESMTSEEKTADESMTSEEKTADESMTSEEKTADESMTSEEKTADESMTSEEKTADESMTSDEKTPDESTTSDEKTIDESITSTEKTADESMTSAEKTGDNGTSSSMSVDEKKIVDDDKENDAVKTDDSLVVLDYGVMQVDKSNRNDNVNEE